MTFRLLRRRKAPSTREPDPERCPAHLQWVRGFSCLAERAGNCKGRIQAHHAREGNLRMGKRPSDRFAVPCCDGHHMELHAHGERTFERTHGVNLLAEAAKLAHHWNSPWHRHAAKMEKMGVKMP